MKILLTFAFVIILFYVLVRYLEATSVFYPAKAVEITPDRFDLPYEDISLRTEDGVTINGWLIKQPSAKSTVLFFHGNAGNMSDRLTKLKMFHDLGIQTFIIDYRGFGRSEGKPTEQGVYRDGRAAFDFLRSRDDLKSLPVVIYGGSLGGAVAIDVASHRKVDGLIIDSSFPSAAAMSRIIYPMIPTFFLALKFDSETKIKSQTMPKLFMHSVDDTTVPLRMGQRLFEAAAQPKAFTELTGRHNDAHVACKDIFLGAIKTFLTKNGWL